MEKYVSMINEVVDFIEQNIAEEINVIDMAKRMDISPWHFQRLFKTMVGDSLGAYLRGRRLSIASEMLLESDRSIIDIAFGVGFNSHEALTRSFKNVFNISPKNYRKEKPQVLTMKKPMLTDDLFSHISNGIQREPIIMDMPGIFLNGYDIQIPSPFVSDENICEIIATPWFKLLEEKKDQTPKDLIGITISPSGNYTEDKLQFVASEIFYEEPIVESSQRVALRIPKQKVAAFNIFSDIEEDIARKTIDYIYGYWLPNSNYMRGKGHDYEFFGNVVDFRDPGSFTYRYVIPVEDKAN